MARTYNGRFEFPEEPIVQTRWLVAGLVMIPTWGSFVTFIASICCFVKYGKQLSERRLFNLFQRFCSVIGPRGRVPLRDLQTAVPSGTGKKEVVNLLQKMLSRGYFGPDAYLDVSAGELVLPDAADDTLYSKAQGVVKSWKDALGGLFDSLRAEKIFQGTASESDLNFNDRRGEQANAYSSKSAHDAFSPLRDKDNGNVNRTRNRSRDEYSTHDKPSSRSRSYAQQPGSFSQSWTNSQTRSSANTNTQGKATSQPNATRQSETAMPQDPAPKHAQPKRTYAEELDAALNELYRLNEQIVDEGVSQRVDRIGTLTAGIFRVVIEKPEREQDVRKFMNYYLPTTLKLLRSYRMLEQQTYQSENIIESRKKIEGILDTLIQGYEKLLNRLFSDDAMDIATDVDVLEMMMANDGLM